MNGWHKIPHAPNYEITVDGRVRNAKTGKELKPHLNPSGYLIICLHGSTRGRTFSIHRLIAEQFVPGADDDLQVNHKDGNKLNNAPSNLEWVTQSQNALHRFSDLGHKQATPKLSEQKVRELVAYRNATGASMSVTAHRFGVNPSMVGAIFAGRVWKGLWPTGKPECLVPRYPKRKRVAA